MLPNHCVQSTLSCLHRPEALELQPDHGIRSMEYRAWMPWGVEYQLTHVRLVSRCRVELCSCLLSVNFSLDTAGFLSSTTRRFQRRANLLSNFLFVHLRLFETSRSKVSMFNSPVRQQLLPKKAPPLVLRRCVLPPGSLRSIPSVAHCRFIRCYTCT